MGQDPLQVGLDQTPQWQPIEIPEDKRISSSAINLGHMSTRPRRKSPLRPTRRALEPVEKEEVAMKRQLKSVCEYHRKAKTKVLSTVS